MTANEHKESYKVSVPASEMIMEVLEDWLAYLFKNLSAADRRQLLFDVVQDFSEEQLRKGKHYTELEPQKFIAEKVLEKSEDTMTRLIRGKSAVSEEDLKSLFRRGFLPRTLLGNALFMRILHLILIFRFLFPDLLPEYLSESEESPHLMKGMEVHHVRGRKGRFYVLLMDWILGAELEPLPIDKAPEYIGISDVIAEKKREKNPRSKLLAEEKDVKFVHLTNERMNDIAELLKVLSEELVSEVRPLFSDMQSEEEEGGSS